MGRRHWGVIFFSSRSWTKTWCLWPKDFQFTLVTPQNNFPPIYSSLSVFTGPLQHLIFCPKQLSHWDMSMQISILKTWFHCFWAIHIKFYANFYYCKLSISFTYERVCLLHQWSLLIFLPVISRCCYLLLHNSWSHYELLCFEILNSVLITHSNFPYLYNKTMCCILLP